MDLNDIPKNYVAKRAMEVALAGRFTIVFVGSPRTEMDLILSFCDEHRITAYGKQPCDCGYLLDDTRECICGKPNLAFFWQDMFVALEVVGTDIVHFLEKGQKGESWEAVVARINGMTNFDDKTLDNTCQSLLKAALTNLEISSTRARKTLDIARVIANLDHKEAIQFRHLAEAIQYCPRRLK